MKCALVFNPFKYKCHEENLRIVQKYFGLFPPLSLAYVAAIMEESGHDVLLIDARTLNLSMDETYERIKAFNPDVLGFMATTYMFRDTLEWIKYLRERLKVFVLVGGYNLRIYPKATLQYPEIDFGIVEHAYYTVPVLLSELEKDTPAFNNVPGLVYKDEEGKISITDHPQKIIFDDFPFPARHLLPNHLYAEFPTERRNFTVMLTSLGCPFGCSFCEAGHTDYNPRSPENVIKEIEECYYKYGIREIDIFDYEFTGIRGRVLDICKLLIERNMDIYWACRSRIDTVDEEMLSYMYKAGCRRIYFGIESGNQKILDMINKGITLEQIETTVKAVKKYKIKVLGFFLIAAPGDTKETVKETVRFAKKLDLDYVQFSKCTAKPFSGLWERLVAETGRDYWSEWVSGTAGDSVLARPWTVLTEEETDKLAKWAYVSYHFRLKFILRHLISLRSFKEFKRKFRAFFDMVFSQERITTEDMNFKAYDENK